MLNGPEHLKVIFDRLQLHFRRKGIDFLERNIIESTYRDTDTITCTHQTRLISGVQLHQEAYPVFSILKRDTNDTWLIASGSYALPVEPNDGTSITADFLKASDPLD